MGCKVELKTLSLDRFHEFLTNSDTLPVERAYRDVAWFRRAVDIRAEAVRSFPFDVKRGDDVIATEDDLDGLDERLNIAPLLDDLSADLDLYGAAYAVYEDNRFGRNGAWRRLHPSTMTPDVDVVNGLRGFTRRINGQQISYDLSENAGTFVYLWIPNRAAEIGPGPGVATAALGAATILDNSTKFKSAFFENGALSPTIVTIAGYDTLGKDEQDRIRGLFRRMMTGVKNAFKVIPVSGETSVASLMQPLSDMELEGLTVQQREDIATAFGVPHSLLFSNAANFATASQDDLNFYDKAIVPQVRLIQAQLNRQLFLPAGERLVFAPERLEVYQQLEGQKADKYVLLFDRGIITAEQLAEFMGVEYTPDSEPDEELEAATDRLADPDEDQTSAAAEALRKWRKVATRRFAEGKPDKALAFDSDCIPPALHDSITRTLGLLVDGDGDVAQVFDDAALWLAVHA